MRLILALSTIVILSGCGTASGILEGTGTVLEGVSADLRSVSSFMR